MPGAGLKPFRCDCHSARAPTFMTRGLLARLFSSLAAMAFDRRKLPMWPCACTSCFLASITLTTLVTCFSQPLPSCVGRQTGLVRNVLEHVHTHASALCAGTAIPAAAQVCMLMCAVVWCASMFARGQRCEQTHTHMHGAVRHQCSCQDGPLDAATCFRARFCGMASACCALTL
jgi:hypothetical protein